MNKNKDIKRITVHMVITKKRPAIHPNYLHSSTTNCPATQETQEVMRFPTDIVFTCPNYSLNDLNNLATQEIKVQVNEIPNCPNKL